MDRQPDSEASAPQEEAWRRCLCQLGIEGATMLWQKGCSYAQRTYVHQGWVWKLHLLGHDRDNAERCGNLRHEFTVVRRCADLREVPRAMRFVVTPCYLGAAYELVHARRLREADLTASQWLAVLAWCVTAVLRLSFRGITHNDLTPDNVLVSNRLRVFIVDFDQAEITSVPRALWRNFLQPTRWRAYRFRMSMWGLTEVCLTKVAVDLLPISMLNMLRRLLR